MINPLLIDGESLTINDLNQVVRHNRPVEIAESSNEKIKQSRQMLERKIEEGDLIYGINTGFGPLVSVLIPHHKQQELQQNLIRSHAANVGPLFEEEAVAAALVMRLNAFAKGYSAIRPQTVALLQSFINYKIYPCIPQWGSVGASGDLTPSAHIALALMGEGEVFFKQQKISAMEALILAGLEPVKLEAKEGLALINGTTMMTGLGALQLADAWNLVYHAEIISALSMCALGTSIGPFDPNGQKVKNHPGQQQTAQNLLKLLAGNSLVQNEIERNATKEKIKKEWSKTDAVFDTGVHLQDVYSLRATPQIIGAVRDALQYVTIAIEIEMNSANDNPLFLVENDKVYHGAHFHGQTVALPLDTAAIALTEIAILSERRLNKMLDPLRSAGLTPFLAGNEYGLHCGYEGAQYIPTSLVAECKILCTPASIQSIPSNGENQDVVSMGLIAARKLRDIKERVEYVLAVELLVACQALNERGTERLDGVIKDLFNYFRFHIPANDKDRILSKDIERTKNLIHNQELVQLVKKKISDYQ